MKEYKHCSLFKMKIKNCPYSGASEFFKIIFISSFRINLVPIPSLQNQSSTVWTE